MEEEKKEHPPINEGKMKALEVVLQKIEKEFGKGAIMQLGKMPKLDQEALISTGSIGLDLALGGGIPRGRIVEIFGLEASGKTTLALHIIAEAQKKGGICAFIDAEHALDPSYAQALGVDTDNLYISQPDTGEDALEIVDTLVRSGTMDVIAVDSVAALVPKVEIDGEMGDQRVGLQARLMSQALRKLTGAISRTKTIVVFLNQLREQIGAFSLPGQGPQMVTTGGRALKYYSSVRIEIKKVKIISEGDNPIGVETKVKVLKNKVAPPFREAHFEIIYGKGINKIVDILDTAIRNGIIKQRGRFYDYNEQRFADSEEKAKAYLEQNKELCQEIENKLRSLVVT